jgi:hypothetical protein
LKATVGLYLSSFVLLSLLKMVMPWHLNWVNNFLQEMSSVFVISVVVYILAPNPKLFSRHNMFDEESLPWLHRNILQRLLESGEDGAEGLLFLVHGDRRSDGSLLSAAGSAPPAKVDFGDGNASDLHELVVFEFPRELSTTNVSPTPSEGKGKSLEEDDDDDYDATATTTAMVGGGVAASGRYLAIGTVERLVARETAKRKTEEAEAEAKGSARGSGPVDEEGGGEGGGGGTSLPPRRREEGAQHQEDTWQRRRWRLLRGQEQPDEEEAREVEGGGDDDDENEIELVIMRRSRRRDADVEHAEGEGRAVDEEEEEDLKGTEKRALLPSSSSSSASFP